MPREKGKDNAATRAAKAAGGRKGAKASAKSRGSESAGKAQDRHVGKLHGR